MLSNNNIILYKPNVNRISTLCFNILGHLSSDVISILDKNDIYVRGGLHCAILAHKQLGTVETGAIRVSLNYTNTFEEIDCFLTVLRGINK